MASLIVGRLSRQVRKNRWITVHPQDLICLVCLGQQSRADPGLLFESNSLLNMTLRVTEKGADILYVVGDLLFRLWRCLFKCYALSFSVTNECRSYRKFLSIPLILKFLCSEDLSINWNFPNGTNNKSKEIN